MSLKEQLDRKKKAEWISDIYLRDLCDVKLINMESHFSREAANRPFVYSDLFFKQTHSYEQYIELWGFRDLTEEELAELEVKVAKVEERRAKRKEAAAKAAETRRLNKEREERALLEKLKQKYDTDHTS